MCTCVKGLQSHYNQVAMSVENKKAKLVIMGQDVEPPEMVLLFAELCNRNRVPFVVVDEKQKLQEYAKPSSCIAVLEATDQEMEAITSQMDKSDDETKSS